MNNPIPLVDKDWVPGRPTTVFTIYPGTENEEVVEIVEIKNDEIFYKRKNGEIWSDKFEKLS